MKLTMSLLAERLRQHKCYISITDNSRNILAVKWIIDRADRRDTAYVGRLKDFIDSPFQPMGNDTDAVIVFQNDFIIVHDFSPEEVMNEVLSALEEYNNWEETLRSFEKDQGGLSKMLESSVSVIPFPLFVYEKSGRILAISQSYPADLHWQWNNLLTNRIVSDEQMEYFKSYGNMSFVFSDESPRKHKSPFGKYDFIHTNLILNHTVYAHLVASYIGESDNNTNVCYLLEILKKHIEDHLDYCSSYYYSLQPAELLLQEILSQKKEHLTLDEQAELLLEKWTVDDEYQVILIQELVDMAPVMLPKLFMKLEKSMFNCRVALHASQIIILTDTTENSKSSYPFEKTLNSLVGPAYITAYSYQFRDLNRLAEFCSQCQIVLNYAKKDRVPVLHARDCSFSYLTDILVSDRTAFSFISGELLLLQKIDAEKGTEYYHTLETYVYAGCQISEASRILNTHRNTITKRLQRIEELVGFSPFSLLDDPSFLKYLQLSFIIISANTQQTERHNHQH